MNKIENKSEDKNTKPPKAKLKPSEVIFRVLTGIVLFIFLLVGAYAFYINKKIDEFKKYDLSELNDLDFIFQTCDFNKYVVFGSKEKRILSEYTDEMNVYYVKGSASISFNNLEDRLKPAWDLCDYDKGILRLKYVSKNEKECPFDISVNILPENIYFVTGIESKEINLPLKDLQFDLVKSENPEDTILRAKEEIEEEFKNDIMIDFKKDKKHLCLENDTFRAFLNSLTEMIINNPNSKWKNVEIVFEQEAENEKN